MKKPADKKSADELLTVRDFIRYGVSRFNEVGLSYGHGTGNAYDEAVYLVLETLHLPLDQLEPYFDARLTKAERKAVAVILEKRVKTRKPAAYLTNKGYVQGLQFYVDERVIVPRSYIGDILCSDLIGGDEETLIDDPTAVNSVLDLCTGSGCLAILAAHVFPFADVDAVDLSPDALAVAKINVKKHDCAGRVTLYKGDLFKPLKGKKYDLIITNPPYVHSELIKTLPPEHRHEPKMALASGDDGLDIVRRILKEAPDYLTEDGGLLCEIGEGQALLESQYPDLEFKWLDTELSEGEVFWLTREQLVANNRISSGSR
ncbi:MAG: 50S ribosomal protein L3 N(5)-glutamine methyltransferase [Alphaproteobacteria bacterium]|nr:50S ribosomal protein L3 N(5)-glutamine methyltransferase [Alphaproteobacteria bacterium]